jgi:hypothetical protein
MSVIAANTDVAIRVKCRIGVNDYDSYNEPSKALLFMSKFWLEPVFLLVF